jgi:methylmalonyl-CoA mutase cobalamin-binding subunit
VLRVNSPGGSAVASAIIGRELDLTKEVKPVIVSMGNYAASGGYWISAKGDYIFADPTTLTGSIGVFGTFPNAKGFLNDKVGLTFDVAKTNENAEFPNFTERVADKLGERPACKCCCAHDEEGAVTLNRKRLASQFEDLRLATEHAQRAPKAFMLTIGNLAMRLARAQFACNFFACAGYELIDNNGFKTVEEGINAAMDKQADIVVLCSSDDEYAELIPQAVELLADRAELVLAGPETDDFKALGIKHFINVRSNVLGTLKAFNDKLLNK